VTVDPADQDALMKEILQIAKENFWMMGIVRMPREYGVRKKNLANVPEWYWSSWAYPHPAPTNPEQFFWDI
jgi:peptide/nickel transport system substrate-binding protein